MIRIGLHATTLAGLLIASIASWANPAAAQATCKNHVCVEIQRISDNSRPLLRARVILTSTGTWAGERATHFNVRIEGGPQMELRPSGNGTGPLSFELQRGQRNFSAQTCRRFALRSECNQWAAFSDELAAPSPPPPSAPQNVAFCENYANTAVARAGEYLKLKCGGPEPRWSANKSLHLDWCVALRGDQALPNKETAARQSGLDACKRKRAEAVTPAPTGDFKKQATALSPATPKPPVQQGATAKNDVNIHNGPGPTPKYKIIGMMRPTHPPAKVLNYHADGWCLLERPIPAVSSGWVAKDHLNNCP